MKASLASLASFSCTYSISRPKTRRFLLLHVRSQSFKDEGSSSNMVDANLGVLRARIQEVMKNEKMVYNKTTPKRKPNIGLNNINSIRPSLYETQDKNGFWDTMKGTTEVVGLVSGSFGLVVLFGSLLIFLVSVLVHLGL